MERLNAKVSRVYEYNKRSAEDRKQVDLKRLSKELLAGKKKKPAQETFLLPELRNEGNCWSEFYKYFKKGKGNREIIHATTERSLRTALEKLTS